MIQLYALRVFREAKEVLSIASKFLDITVGNLHVVYSMVGNDVLIEFPSLKRAGTGFASACLSCVQSLEKGRLGLPPLEIAACKIHFEVVGAVTLCIRTQVE